MSRGGQRNLGVCVEDTLVGANACHWTVENIYREGDVLHLMYVIKSLKPPMEVFHQLPGTSFSFSQPGSHHEEEKIRAAKRAIEKRFIPILERRGSPIPYQLHLFAEKHDAGPEAIGKDLVKCAEDIPCDIVVLTSHQQEHGDKLDRFEGNVTKVNEYVSKNCSKTICIV